MEHPANKKASRPKKTNETDALLLGSGTVFLRLLFTIFDDFLLNNNIQHTKKDQVEYVDPSFFIVISSSEVSVLEREKNER